jgi:hypothetical protein
MKTCFSHLLNSENIYILCERRKFADFVYNSAGISLHFSILALFTYTNTMNSSHLIRQQRSQYDDDKMSKRKKKLFFYAEPQGFFFLVFSSFFSINIFFFAIIIIATLNHANDTSLHAPSLTRFSIIASENLLLNNAQHDSIN